MRQNRSLSRVGDQEESARATKKKLAALLAVILVATMPATARQDSEAKPGDIVTLGANGDVSFLAPDEKLCRIFDLLWEINGYASGVLTSDQSPRIWEIKSREVLATLQKGVRDKVYVRIDKPTKARITSLPSQTTADGELELCVQVEVTSGPHKGGVFWFGQELERTGPVIGEQCYLWEDPNSKGKPGPVNLTFNQTERQRYVEALDSGDKATVASLQKTGRLWKAAPGTVGRVVEKNGRLDVRVEISSGPLKGRKGWTHLFAIHRKPSQ